MVGEYPIPMLAVVAVITRFNEPRVTSTVICLAASTIYSPSLYHIWQRLEEDERSLAAVGPRRLWVSLTRPSRSRVPPVDDGEVLHTSAALPLTCEVLCIERKAMEEVWNGIRLGGATDKTAEWQTARRWSASGRRLCSTRSSAVLVGDRHPPHFAMVIWDKSTADSCHSGQLP